jgi:hypothetical protein
MKTRWIALPVMSLIALAAGQSEASAQEAAKSDKVVEIIVSEYSPVAYVIARGAPLTTTVRGMEITFFELTYGVADQGEYNQRTGFRGQKYGQWVAGGRLAMHLCGYLYKDTKPVVDVTPDAAKPGEALECKVLVKSERLDPPQFIDDYEFTWKKFEGTDKEFKDGKGKWLDADVPKGPKLAAGVTKEGERWACSVQPLSADGKPLTFSAADVVEIGKEKPGDSRINWSFGSFYGQYRYTRGYFKFDVSALAGKKIKSAKFRLFCDVQDPPFVVNAYACPNAWSEKEITWVNQPLKFPFADAPVGSVKMDFGPLPTPENPASKADWSLSSSPDFKNEKQNRAPAWREIDVTDYARKVLASGEKGLSLCLACESQSKDDHSRIHIHNERIAPGYTLDRGDMRPRLSVEVE